MILVKDSINLLDRTVCNQKIAIWNRFAQLIEEFQTFALCKKS